MNNSEEMGKGCEQIFFIGKEVQIAGKQENTHFEILPSN